MKQLPLWTSSNLSRKEINESKGKENMKVFLIAGARPNFMKIAPIYRVSLGLDDVECKIIHTGQHYDH